MPIALQQGWVKTVYIYPRTIFFVQVTSTEYRDQRSLSAKNMQLKRYLYYGIYNFATFVYQNYQKKGNNNVSFYTQDN